MLTTVQDLGRWGWQASGVPVAGPMDIYSHALANRLAGNPDDAAALEVTLIGPELRADDDVVCAVAGASFALTVAGRAVGMHRPFVIRQGESVRFGHREHGARATVAFRGGISGAMVFGSRATSVLSRMGPFPMPLAAGDRLPIGADAGDSHPPGAPLGMPAGGARVRVMRGPHDRSFTTAAWEMLLSDRYQITPQSNRMGYRLDGPRLEHAGSPDILSDATPHGSLQVPGSGQPILLMADRQTTGGYPKIATVITADLPLAGQLAPGDWIQFVECTREAALEALALRNARLDGTPR